MSVNADFMPYIHAGCTPPTQGFRASAGIDGRLVLLSIVSIDGLRFVDQDGQNPASYAVRFTVGGVAMSLCWCSNTDESKASLNVRLLLALDEFLFEDIPRCAGLLCIWASGGAAWFLWLYYLWCIRYRC
jgi:hypothetical protein